MKLDIKTAGKLFELRAVGALARCFDVAGVEPSETDWDMFSEPENITLRYMAETAFRLDMAIELMTTGRDTQDEAAK